MEKINQLFMIYTILVLLNCHSTEMACEPNAGISDYAMCIIVYVLWILWSAQLPVCIGCR